MSVHLVILSCIFCCPLGALSLPPGSSFTNDAADADVDDEPDLLHMLDFLKGKSDVGELTTFLKQYKGIIAFMVRLMDICVPCKEVYSESAKTNTGIRILDKIAHGQAPDIKDMYDLATKGVGNMSATILSAQRKNKKYATIANMYSKGSVMLSSPPLLQEFLKDVTGRQFTIDPSLMKEVNDGSVQFTKNNIAQVNLLLIIASWTENSGLTHRIGQGFNNPPFDFIKALETLQSYDTSSLSKIKAISGGMDNNKYTVSGGGMTFVTDPGVVKIQQDLQRMSQLLKTKSQDQSAAESLILEALTDFSNLTFGIVNKAENPRKEPPL